MLNNQTSSQIFKQQDLLLTLVAEESDITVGELIGFLSSQISTWT